jgi:hypothetical protein
VLKSCIERPRKLNAALPAKKSTAAISPAVDVEGYVSVNAIRYSVPVAWIGRRVEARETQDKIEIELDARHLVMHVRAVTPQAQRPPRGEGVQCRDPHPEEQAIVQAVPEIAAYVTALKQKGRKVVALALRQPVALAERISARAVPGRGPRSMIR